MVDTPEKNVSNIGVMLKNAIQSIPELCRIEYGYDFSLPIGCEIKVGDNKNDMMLLLRDNNGFVCMKEINKEKVNLGTYPTIRKALDVWSQN